MLFSVIYTFDCVKSRRVGYLSPLTSQPRLWKKTEGNSEYEYNYLEGDWVNGKHGKYCSLLTRKQFDHFIRQMGLVADPVETMGSLGGLMPDGERDLGVMPAIAFNGDEYDAILSAYVTPFPEVHNKKSPYSERDWDRVKRAIVEKYR